MAITTATLGIEVTTTGTEQSVRALEQVNAAAARIAQTSTLTSTSVVRLQKSVSSLHNTAQSASAVLFLFGNQRMQELVMTTMAATNAVQALGQAVTMAGSSFALAAVRLGIFAAAAAAVSLWYSSQLDELNTQAAEAEERAARAERRAEELRQQRERARQEAQQEIETLKLRQHYAEAAIQLNHVWIPLESRRFMIEQRHRDLLQLYNQLLEKKVITEKDHALKTMEAEIERNQQLIALRQEEIGLIQSRWDLTNVQRFRMLHEMGMPGHELGPDPTSWAEQFRMAMVGIADAWTSWAAQMAGAFRSNFEHAISIISDGISSLIIGTRTWAQALSQIGLGILQQIVHSIVQIGVRWVATQIMIAAFGKSLMLQGIVAAAPMAAAAAAQWAPAAVAASTATMGAAAVAGASALTSAAASAAPILSALSAAATAPGFQRGGFTGWGPEDRPAGIVHAGEWVMPASTVRAWGHDMLAAIQAGPGATPRPEVRVHLYFDRRAWLAASREDIEGIALDAFRRAVI
jgi:hypothetical protein